MQTFTNIFHKIKFNLILLFNSFFRGMKEADTIIDGPSSMSDDVGSSIEQKMLEKSVYADLLRGEVTQQVKELRHEMYYAERKSHDYKYAGNGRVKKKKKQKEIKGNFENSDNLKVILIQDNIQDDGSLVENFNDNLDNRFDKQWTIRINREITPRFKIEEYASKIIVKEIDEDNLILDIYAPTIPKEFDRRSRMFINEIKKNIELNDFKTDTFDFDNLHFTTYKAIGADDLNVYEYKDVSFKEILEYNDFYIFRFKAKPKNHSDIVEEFYDKIAAKKFENHEMREGKSINLDTAMALQQEEKYDVDTALDLIKHNKKNA